MATVPLAHDNQRHQQPGSRETTDRAPGRRAIARPGGVNALCHTVIRRRLRSALALDAIARPRPLHFIPAAPASWLATPSSSGTCPDHMHENGTAAGRKV